jgi:hypothetical protein
LNLWENINIYELWRTGLGCSCGTNELQGFGHAGLALSCNSHILHSRQQSAVNCTAYISPLSTHCPLPNGKCPCVPITVPRFLFFLHPLSLCTYCLSLITALYPLPLSPHCLCLPTASLSPLSLIPHCPCVPTAFLSSLPLFTHCLSLPTAPVYPLPLFHCCPCVPTASLSLLPHSSHWREFGALTIKWKDPSTVVTPT